MATTTTGTTGWNCVGTAGRYEWSAWSERGGMHGTALSMDDGRDQAALASEILNRPKGDA